MKLYHLSSSTNSKSILKEGIKPSYIKLYHHWSCFNNDGLDQRECVYMWSPVKSKSSTAKLIKDMIYCKLFLHPRNDMIKEEKDGSYSTVDFKEFGGKLFGGEDSYDLYEINIKEASDILIQKNYMHAQGMDEDDFIYMQDKTDPGYMMLEEYSHNDKVIYIGKETISPKNIKIISTFKSIISKERVDVEYIKGKKFCK